MEISGDFRIPAPRERVWAALNDPEVLQKAIPGCEEIERLSDTELAARVALKVGPVRARFKGKVTLSDLDPPRSYRIDGEGQGGVAGFARGGAKVTLDEVEDGTLLHYEANAEVGGKLAQVGQRLLDSTARKLADQFFSAFTDIVTAEAEGEAAAAPAPAAAEKPEAEPQGLSPWIWAGGLLFLIAVLLAFFAK